MDDDLMGIVMNCAKMRRIFGFSLALQMTIFLTPFLFGKKNSSWPLYEETKLNLRNFSTSLTQLFKNGGLKKKQFVPLFDGKRSQL